jgi:Predicted nucleotidyltransferase
MDTTLDDIQTALDEVEKSENVEILLAVESGSRAWGFASPDSDYDVRFIYLRKKEEYLRVDETKEYIDWALDEVLDINGWDLKKTLLAFGKGNPNLIEWMGSPIVYRKSDKWDRIAAVARECFSEKASLNHYYGTAKSTYQKFLTGEKVKYKKYFYALRPLLCCKWIERYHEIPPMEFDDLLKLFDGTDRELSDELLSAIKGLVEKKVVTVEGELNDRIPMIHSFIELELLRQRDNAEMAEDDRITDFTKVNEIFREIVQGE